MNDLFVAEHARGTGVAEALIAACAERCRERGATSLDWSTARDNRRAQRVYDRVGGRARRALGRLLARRARLRPVAAVPAPAAAIAVTFAGAPVPGIGASGPMASPRSELLGPGLSTGLPATPSARQPGRGEKDERRGAGAGEQPGHAASAGRRRSAGRAATRARLRDPEGPGVDARQDAASRLDRERRSSRIDVQPESP